VNAGPQNAGIFFRGNHPHILMAVWTRLIRFDILLPDASVTAGWVDYGEFETKQ